MDNTLTAVDVCSLHYIDVVELRWDKQFMIPCLSPSFSIYINRDGLTKLKSFVCHSLSDSYAVHKNMEFNLNASQAILYDTQP